MTHPAGRRLGFLQGASSVVQALQFVATTPRTWALVATPTLLFLVLLLIGTSASGAALTSELRSALPVDAWLAPLGSAGVWIGWLLTGALSLVLGFAFALVLTPVLSAPAIERLVNLQAAVLGLPSDSQASFFRQLICGLKAQLLPALITIPVLGMLWLITWLLPFLAPVTVLLKLFIAALGVAWSCFDYPLTLRGVSLRARLALLSQDIPTTLGFACACALLVCVPCLALVALPVGAIAATRVLSLLTDVTPPGAR